MRAYIGTLVIGGSLTAFVIGAATTARRERPSPSEGTSFNAAEVKRVRAHFDGVLVELRANGHSQRTPAQRDRRATLLRTLRAYKQRGEFPKNYDFPDRQVPYFVDRKTGVRCAVAFLLESTGRSDIVQRVAAGNNNVRVAQLARDTAFIAWLHDSGLTLSEASRIQPAYGPPVQDRRRERSQYRNVSVVAMTASIAATLWNGDLNEYGQSRTTSILGLGVGIATVGIGLLGERTSDASTGFKVGNYASGSAATFVAVRSLVRRHRSDNANARTRETANAPAGLRATLSPTISLADQKSAGVMVNVKF